MTEPTDESLANYWADWPAAARDYRARKQQQVERLQHANEALRDAVRARDVAMLAAAHAIESFLLWWHSEDLEAAEHLGKLGRAAARLRGLLST